MLDDRKIPVVVGITGHRDIVEEDKPTIKAQVKQTLQEIKELCRTACGEQTPVIMLNAFAQGADMLCAEAAFELNIPIVAVLPFEGKYYKETFNNEADKNKLDDYLAKAERIIIAPDIEDNKEWLQKVTKANGENKGKGMDDDSYRYRQLGIYIAEHSHALIALWDGKKPKSSYGCGTIEVIKFALETNFLNEDHLFKPGLLNDCAVCWIKSRRQGDGSEADIRRSWISSKLAGVAEEQNLTDNISETNEVGGVTAQAESENDEHYATDNFRILQEMPGFFKSNLAKISEYNGISYDIPSNDVKLWNEVGELDDYRKKLRYHYAKADNISYNCNQKKYNRLMLLLAVLGAIIAATFLIYDDASLPHMIFPCAATLIAVIAITVFAGKKGYHKNYIEYRALAEALRIQFYMSMCLNESIIETYVTDLYSWSQKVDMVWVDKLVKSLSVIGAVDENKKFEVDKVKNIWIGCNGEKPTGQLKYHRSKLAVNKHKLEKYELGTNILMRSMVGMYFLIFAIEIVALILRLLNVDFFWEGELAPQFSWRNFAAIILGAYTVGALLFSSHWGKLSYDRKLDDNVKMSMFYASALSRWQEIDIHSKGEAEQRSAAEFKKFVMEIAREEIIENGIWYSYVNENKLEINL
jgi:hypothetical protein